LSYLQQQVAYYTSSVLCVEGRCYLLIQIQV